MSRGLPEYNRLMRFTINDVCNWLAENKFGEFVKMFREHGIDGNRFVTLEDLDLTKMRCPMNKRRDLLRLVKDLPKPADPRVKGIVQPQVPATPTRDYNHRPPAPAPIQTNQNGVMAHDDDDDGSGPEDDYAWGASDFSDVSSSEEKQYLDQKSLCIRILRSNLDDLDSDGEEDSDSESDFFSSDEEDYENVADKNLPETIPSRNPPRQQQQQPDQEDSDSNGSYEEPEPQIPPPPPSVPRRDVHQVAAPSGPSKSPQHGLPVNRRPVPQIPKIPQMSTMDQTVYEETDEESDQPVYEDPDSEPVKKTEKRPETNIPRKVMPMRTISQPDSPAPPPPRAQKGNKKPADLSAPAPPPPRGGRKQHKPPSPEPEEQGVYEDLDNPTQSQQPPTGRKGSGPLKHPPQDDFPQDTYEEPDVLPSTVRKSALPSLPKEAYHTPVPEPDEQGVYEDPDEPVKPSRGKIAIPPTSKVSHPHLKVSQPTKKAPPPKQEVFEQDTYEEPDVLPSTVRKSALPSLPKEAYHTPVPEPDEQDVYEDPDEPVKPSRGKIAIPPTLKVSHPPPKVSQPTKKAPPLKQEVFEQLDYEVPEDMMQMPQDDYMEMHPSINRHPSYNHHHNGPHLESSKEPEVKRGQRILPSIPPVNGESRTHQLPPAPGKNKQVPPPPTDNVKKNKNRPLPQPVDNPVGLDDQPWYHGDIARQVADNKLVECGTNGCYLIRRSKNGGETKPYTLAIMFSGQVFNLNIRKKTNSKYALGMAKPDEQEFPDLLELVKFFSSHRLILAKGQTRLKKPCLK